MLTWKVEKIQNVINFPDMILHSLGARCVIIFCPQIEHKNFLVLKFQIILYLKAYQNFAFKYISICSCALCDGENNKNGALVKLLRTTSHAWTGRVNLSYNCIKTALPDP